LTGALFVGDSLRGSLRALALEQLGWVDHSLVTGRFFREALASQLGEEQVSPAILLQGAASASPKVMQASESSQSIQRVGRVMVLGINDRFWYGRNSNGSQQPHYKSTADSTHGYLVVSHGPVPDPWPAGKDLWQSNNHEVVLNQALADDLSVGPGDQITLHLQKVSAIPRETLLGRREASDVLDDLRVTVRAVVPNDGLGRFSLYPQPITPRNAYLPLRALQTMLKQDGRVNALLVGGGNRTLQERLHKLLRLEDWGLVLRTPESRTLTLLEKLDRNKDGRLEPREWRRRVAQAFVKAVDGDRDGLLQRDEILQFYRKERNYFSLESRQMLLEPAVADAAIAAAKETGLRAAPTIVYLANGISNGTQTIPYSIVAALDPSLDAPMGPFLPAGAPPLADNEILLADWRESPLKVQPGDRVSLSYFLPEIEGRLKEVSESFRLRGLVPLSGAAADPDLTPEFPGITDKLDIRDWNPPFPYDNKRIQPADEHFWEQYRTTPKAYVTLAQGQRLWGSRFGKTTSIRLAAMSSTDAPALEEFAETFTNRLLQHLRPEYGGFVFEAVRQRALAGSSGAADFGGLFLGFSFFLIVAALLLVGLLLRLNLDRRAPEIGLLMAAGFGRGTVRRLMLIEGAVVALTGGLIGLVAARLYAWLMLELLRAWWPGGLEKSFLGLHTSGLSYAIGYGSSVLISVLTIIWAVRVLGRVSPKTLLTGLTTEAGPSLSSDRPSWSLWLAAGTALLALALFPLGRAQANQELQAMAFFGSGALILTGGLAASWSWMRRTTQQSACGTGWWSVARLGFRNAARHSVRSLLTAGLLAAAAFLIVGVRSFFRDPARDFLTRQGGSGGFTLLAESDVPIFQDLNTANGQDELNFSAKTRSALRGVTYVPFRLRGGDDASCLNLYQPRRPRLLGVTSSLVARGGFQFKATELSSAQRGADPWHLLEQTRTDGAVPVFGEANTVEWMLHSGLGREVDVANERGEPVKLRVVGLLQDSVFQSELLMSEANFNALFPRQEGYTFFLMETEPERADAVRTALETALADHGFAVLSTTQRLEAYLAVENTYLSTFQALGGLGLLLGAFGLAVVLLRTIWERRGELALLRALGFRHSALAWLVLSENAFLLVLGLCVGTLAAVVAVMPHLIERRSVGAGLTVAAFLTAVLVVGLATGATAVALTLRAPLLTALRRE
jgi:ABC-type lipoprotein release transport system permease subunit